MNHLATQECLVTFLVAKKTCFNSTDVYAKLNAVAVIKDKDFTEIGFTLMKVISILLSLPCTKEF